VLEVVDSVNVVVGADVVEVGVCNELLDVPGVEAPASDAPVVKDGFALPVEDLEVVEVLPERDTVFSPGPCELVWPKEFPVDPIPACGFSELGPPFSTSAF
jgi:hypothetical protein